MRRLRLATLSEMRTQLRMRNRWAWAGLVAATFALLAAPASLAIEGSLFEHAWQWQDDRGETVAFSRWRGEPLVVTVVYTTCKVRCPMTLNKLRKVEKAFTAKGMVAQFALVTLDPAHDTQEKLKAYKKSRHLADENWHLLNGGQAQTKELLAFLGIKALEDGSHIDHDTKIFVFDREGKAARSFEGWNFEDDKAVVAP